MKASTGATWLGAAVALAVAAWVAGSPRSRHELASMGGRLAEWTGQSVKNLQSKMRSGFGRKMAVLEEMSPTIDAATTQWEASMTVSKVAAALDEEPRLRGRNVAVRLIGGILHLEGDVYSQEERQVAAEVARRASGAELVANDLRIASSIG